MQLWEHLRTLLAHGEAVAKGTEAADAAGGVVVGMAPICVRADVAAASAGRGPATSVAARQTTAWPVTQIVEVGAAPLLPAVVADAPLGFHALDGSVPLGLIVAVRLAILARRPGYVVAQLDAEAAAAAGPGQPAEWM